MTPIDEGLIHAWLDGQLDASEAARVAHLVKTDAGWGAAAAEARGLVAGSSRLLGVLDEVGKVGKVGEVGKGRVFESGVVSESGEHHKSGEKKGATRSRWYRTTWFRVAATIVVVAGVSRLAWMNTSGPLAVRDDVQSAAPSAATPPPVAPPAPPVANETGPGAARAVVPAAPPVIRRDTGARQQNAEQRAEQRRDTRVADAAAADTRRASGRVAEKAVVLAPPPAVTAAAGAGAVGGAPLRAQQQVAGNVAAQEVAKVLADRLLSDSLTVGCWTVQAPAERLADARAEAAPPVVLRFTPPAITDLTTTQVAAPPLTRIGGGRGGRGARMTPPIQFATARPRDDSTYVTEWMNPDGRTTQLVFRVANDTLRGTTTYVAGDMVIAGTELVAVRRPCESR